MSEPTRGRWKVASPATISRIALAVQSVSNRVAQRTDQGLGKTLQGNRRMFTISWLPACEALDWSSTEPEAPQLREVRQEGHAVIPDLSRHPDQLQPVCTSLSRFPAPHAAAWPRSRSTCIPLPPFVLWSKPRRPVLQSSRTGPRPCARRSCTCKAISGAADGTISGSAISSRSAWDRRCHFVIPAGHQCLDTQPSHQVCNTRAKTAALVGPQQAQYSNSWEQAVDSIHRLSGQHRFSRVRLVYRYCLPVLGGACNMRVM